MNSHNLFDPDDKVNMVVYHFQENKGPTILDCDYYFLYVNYMLTGSPEMFN